MVKFVGDSFWTEVWKNGMIRRDYKVMKNRKFNIGIWAGVESVVTSKVEWICDTDSEFFKENFQVL